MVATTKNDEIKDTIVKLEGHKKLSYKYLNARLSKQRSINY